MAAARSKPEPRSCDTFVFVAGPGGPAATLFGKNSDRPSEESHEVVYVPAATHAEVSRVRCTYVEVPQARETLAVVLSRPHWLWGCEMGANERGVVGGNEAVGSMLCSDLGSERRLLGMDLLRLALERGRSAREAVEVCCSLLEAHGQGGGCSEGCDCWTYENGFIFADATEAFVLETAGVHYWCMERVPPGTARNISNSLSIRTSIEACSPEVKKLCHERGWWDGVSDFDWKACVGGAGRGAGGPLAVSGRELAGQQHLSALDAALKVGKLAADDAAAWARGMAAALRDEDSGICFHDVHRTCSTGSQISWLPQGEGGGTAASHLFTAASDPGVACYKHFAFAKDAGGGPEDFRSHELWTRWREVALRDGLAEARCKGVAAEVREGLQALEKEAFAALASPAAATPSFREAVARELALLGTA